MPGRARLSSSLRDVERRPVGRCTRTCRRARAPSARPGAADPRTRGDRRRPRRRGSIDARGVHVDVAGLQRDGERHARCDRGSRRAAAGRSVVRTRCCSPSASSVAVVAHLQECRAARRCRRTRAASTTSIAMSLGPAGGSPHPRTPPSRRTARALTRNPQDHRRHRGSGIDHAADVAPIRRSARATRAAATSCSSDLVAVPEGVQRLLVDRLRSGRWCSRPARSAPRRRPRSPTRPRPRGSRTPGWTRGAPARGLGRGGGCGRAAGRADGRRRRSTGAARAGSRCRGRSRRPPRLRSAARQHRAARARVPRDLLLGRTQRLLRQHREAVVVAERRLHDAVLEGVVRDHDHAATGSEEPDRLRQGGGELLELPVDRDAERLERATRGVGAPRTSSHGAHDHAGELVGGGDRPARTIAPGDPARATLARRTRRSGRRARVREARSRGRRPRARRRRRPPSACRAARRRDSRTRARPGRAASTRPRGRRARRRPARRRPPRRPRRTSSCTEPEPVAVRGEPLAGHRERLGSRSTPITRSTPASQQRRGVPAGAQRHVDDRPGRGPPTRNRPPRRP